MMKNSQDNTSEETLSQVDESQQSPTNVETVSTTENHNTETVIEGKTNESQLEAVSEVKQSGNTITFNIE